MWQAGCERASFKKLESFRGGEKRTAVDDAAFWGLLYLIWYAGVGAIVTIAAIFASARFGKLNSVGITPREGRAHTRLFTFYFGGGLPLFFLHELEFPPPVGAVWLVTYTCAVIAFYLGQATVANKKVQ